jgi:hypothetical protein
MMQVCSLGDNPMKALTARAFILAGLCAVAVPAQATEFSITFRGKVSQGTDAAGIFGAAGADLSGLDYIASFTFDSDVYAIYDRENGSDFDYEGYSLPGTASIKIGNDTYQFSDDIDGGSGSATRYIASEPGADGGYNNDMSVVLQPGGAGLFFTLYAIPAMFPSVDNTTPFSYDGPAGFYGSFGNANPQHYTYADFTFGSVVECNGDGPCALPSANVPEPASWALMVTGFGLAGATLRSRRRTMLAFG